MEGVGKSLGVVATAGAAGTGYELAGEVDLCRASSTPTAGARFCFGDPRPVREATSRRYPLVLVTGRGSSSQWHTETRTGKSAVLATLHPSGPYLEISPADAAGSAWWPGQDMVVTSARSSMRARAWSPPPCARARSSRPCTIPRSTASPSPASTPRPGNPRTSTAPWPCGPAPLGVAGAAGAERAVIRQGPARRRTDGDEPRGGRSERARRR